MAKAPDQRYLSAGDLGRAAVAAASGVTLSRAERSVAVGGAAPLSAEPVAARAATTVPAAEAVPSEAGRPEATAAPGGGGARPAAPGRRTRLSAGALAIVVIAAIGGVIAALSGGGGSTRSGATTSSSALQASTVGIELGRSIRSARLGEPRPRLTADLVGLGYAASPGAGPQETRFTSDRGEFVVGFENGLASYIQKYNDAGIKVRGVSVDSTLRTARLRLPEWRAVRCPPKTLLIAPAGRTYFELPLRPDAANDGSNGIVVTSNPLAPDRSACP
jgi:hypothetical protein